MEIRKYILLILLVFFGHALLFAQSEQEALDANSILIKGTIYDQKDSTLLTGALVSIDGSTRAVLTDNNGAFKIDIPATTFTFNISLFGYETKKIVIGNQRYFSIGLGLASTQLGEIVVTGLGGTQLKSKITGNIIKIEGEEIEGIPVTSFESALQGRAAGVVISKQNGKLGQAINVRIRGAASLTASNEPLYVLDGIILTSTSQSLNNAPTNPLSDLNFNDIASIEILKDAASSTIYGSRASNGVVLITTKNGKAGQSKIGMDISRGLSEPTKLRSWLNSSQYLTLWDEAFDNVADANGRVFDLTANGWKDRQIPEWDFGDDSDWEFEAFNPDAGFFQTNVFASGGSEKTQFYISGSYLDQEGILIYNEFERISGRLNLSHQLRDNFKIGVNLNLIRSTNQRLPDDNQFSSPLQLVALPTAQPINDPNDNTQLFEETLYFNGLLFKENTRFETTVYRSLGNLKMDWALLKNLNFHADFGLDLLNQNEDQYFGFRVSRTTQEPGGLGINSSLTTLNYANNNYLNWLSTFGELDSDFTVGLSYQKSDTKWSQVQGRNFPNDDLNTIASAGEISGGSAVKTEWALASYYSRLNLDFKDKYLLSLSARIDGDSRFGAENRFGFFPAVGAAWLISNEAFLEDNKTISFLKLRASYGQTGNTPVANFASRALWGTSRYAGQSATQPTQIANDGLKWEVTNQVDIGLELGFFNNRINAEIDVYNKETRDVLLNVNIPSTSGFTSQLRNIGILENQGVELSLHTFNFINAFKWQSHFNFALNQNEIQDLDGQVIEGGFVNRAIEGESIGVFYTIEYAGVDPANGDALYFINDPENLADRSTTNNPNVANRVAVGSPLPEYTFGFGNDISYKGFEFSFLLQGVIGAQVYNGAGVFQLDGFGWFDNQDVRILDRWQNPGDVTEIPQLRFLANTPQSSRFVENASYVRLKNISVSYTLPSAFVQQLNLEKFKIYMSIQNLLTFSKYQGWDPEVNADFNASNISLGNDFYSAPQARTIVFGLNIGF